MKRILLAVGALLGIAVILGLVYVTDDERVTGAKRRARSVTERPSIQSAVSSTKEAANSAVDAATVAIGQKVDEAAEQFSDTVGNAAEKATKGSRRGA